MIVSPIVHCNGTSAAELLDLRETAYAALDAAAAALCQMAPNGRDYYPQPGLMTQADAQHRRRVQAIRDIMQEIEAECFAISDQENGRA
jgi:hypothetical protein